MCNNNNIPNVNSQVGSGEVRVYADLTPTLGGREAASDSPQLKEEHIEKKQMSKCSHLSINCTYLKHILPYTILMVGL